ncbi:hypothetical protein CLAFUW4_10026 [Fulvia fulva]|uniref:RING-type domain-containing protein n=1 Tax=Passalora fulva TaxID=5499 RepID=A0A9Q8UUN8_PASFU|nr:uncharacterized protein CLAFUR5_12218 [Fulvia fulva]KAK4615733.1 hypothetical protein CLAFUR4_10030 [Fulvia fulva]KAK4616940.1 hypothetical protein CLAFUR0_10028 [Fulvia fulva]UJO22992.1 hypothetical protein CLAFUR5_12218 [Fulvia fulva]WPV18860.1 hypothetical protein CLAFUW4_10026 [Fulvia fulva]WPV34276.1 hypothetical protein CLAFUW7_10027 [Fulvia fulva]
MPGDGSYQTAEGSSRKRVKTSRDAGRPAGLSKSPETVGLVTPAKPEPSVPMIAPKTEDESPTKDICHHEQSLRSLHGDLDEMRQLITCKICQRFLYEPYALTCGHTFCYSCLSQWMGQNKSKTCPDCRTVIKDEPAPSYLIRELVLIFVGRSALLPDGETSEEHNQLAKEEADIVAKDRANTHVETGGLFKGSFKKGTRRAPVEAIRDHGDNVYRCPECTHEVEDGRCSGCGIRVRTEEDDLAWSSDEESVDSDDLELDHELEAEDYDDDTELGLIDAHADVWDPYQPGHPPWQHREWAAPSSDVDLSQDEHEEFMDGFIDDEPINAYRSSDDEQVGHSEAPEVNNNAPQRRRRIEEVSESEEEEEEEEQPVQPRLSRRVPVRVPRRITSEDPSSAAASMVSDPSDSEDESDEEDDEDDEPIRTAQRSRGRRVPARTRRVMTIRSDDDEDDSDAGTNATTQSEAGGFSPIQPAPARQQQEHINYYDDSDVESGADDEVTEHDEPEHIDYQNRDEFGQIYSQYNAGYGEDESDGDESDDQSTATGY